jgi:hypothetical protein
MTRRTVILSQIAQRRLSLQPRRSNGQAVDAYALIIVLVAIVSIGMLTTRGRSIARVVSQANAALQSLTRQWAAASLLRPHPARPTRRLGQSHRL